MGECGVKDFWLLITAWLVAVLVVASGQIADPDLWGRLSVGALWFQGGHFPYHDVFSYTAPHVPWIDHEWLSGVVFYQVLTALGEPAFMLLKYGLILLMLALLFRLHRTVYQAGSLYAFYGVLILLPVLNVGLYPTLRAHVFSFLGFVFFLYWLEALRLGQKSLKQLGWLVPVGVLWGNLHGGFVIGLLALLAYGFGEGLDSRSLKGALPYVYCAIGIVLLLAVLNPYGPGYLGFLWHAWSLNRVHIAEWQPMNFTSLPFWPAQLLVAVTALALLWQVQRVMKTKTGLVSMLAPALVLLLTLAMAVKSMRFQVFLALAVMAYLPLLLPVSFRMKPAIAAAVSRTGPLLLLLGALAGLGYLQAGGGLLVQPVLDEMSVGPGPHYPVGMVGYLRESPYSGRLMNQFGYGEFLYWCLYPRFKIAMDGRYEEIYSQRQADENYLFYRSEKPLQPEQARLYVDHPPADFILGSGFTPGITALQTAGGWRTLYSDQGFLLLGRNDGMSRFPVFKPRHAFMTNRVLTLADFTGPADLQRFRK